jgi:hypothetical protein
MSERTLDAVYWAVNGFVVGFGVATIVMLEILR